MVGNTIEKCNQVVTAGRDTIPVGLFMQYHVMYQMNSIALRLIQDVFFNWPSPFSVPKRKQPFSQSELLLHEILHKRKPLVGSLAYFFSVLNGGGQLKKKHPVHPNATVIMIKVSMQLRATHATQHNSRNSWFFFKVLLVGRFTSNLCNPATNVIPKSSRNSLVALTQLVRAYPMTSLLYPIKLSPFQPVILFC